jgi:hypothetical protein
VSNARPLRYGKPTARELLADVKVIDVDTHVSEWHDLWTSRAPASMKHRMPRFVSLDGKSQRHGPEMVLGSFGKGRWVIEDDVFLSFPGSSAVL